MQGRGGIGGAAVAGSGLWHPPRAITRRAYVKDYEALRAEAARDVAAFWAGQGRELDWYKKWSRVVDESGAPFVKWFVDAKTNIVLNALDRHLATPVKNKLAFIWEGENGEVRTLSYFGLNREVCQFANVLKSMGVNRGDRVTIYMPRILELPIAMLACAKIGAVHSVVYSGFSVEPLHSRIEDSESRVVITADGGRKRGKIIPLKQIADEAAARAATVEHMIVVRHTGQPVNMEVGRDYYYDELMALPIAKPVVAGACKTEVMEADDPLFLLYTSGTAGKPVAVVHTHGGYQVGISTTLKLVFDLRAEDRWWCAADPGWITGHSYVVYAPLILGATSMIYEGASTFPYPDRWWKVVEKYGITTLYTAPSAIRSLMRFGESWPNRRDLSSLRLLGTVGEPIGADVWHWFHRVIGKERCPIMDTWWQTETGMLMIAPVPTFPLKPGSQAKAFPGIKAEVLDDEGRAVKPGETGQLCIAAPWPAMMGSIYKDPATYVNQYWSKYPGKYCSGVSARVDEDGYFWVMGRADDVIKVSGHRLGTAEVETALGAHPAVLEAAAVGVPHEVRGHCICAFVVLRDGVSPSAQLEEELAQLVAAEVGAIARPERIEFVGTLPKTRSGKVMRHLLKARAVGIPEDDFAMVRT